MSRHPENGADLNLQTQHLLDMLDRYPALHADSGAKVIKKFDDFSAMFCCYRYHLVVEVDIKPKVSSRGARQLPLLVI